MHDKNSQCHKTPYKTLCIRPVNGQRTVQSTDTQYNSSITARSVLSYFPVYKPISWLSVKHPNALQTTTNSGHFQCHLRWLSAQLFYDHSTQTALVPWMDAIWFVALVTSSDICSWYQLGLMPTPIFQRLNYLIISISIAGLLLYLHKLTVSDARPLKTAISQRSLLGKWRRRCCSNGHAIF